MDTSKLLMILPNILRLKYFNQLEKLLQHLLDFQLLQAKEEHLIHGETQEDLLLNIILKKVTGI